jgi:signal transduction histidine kinase
MPGVPAMSERQPAGEEALRELSARLREALEEERTRLSRELHDDLGQALTGLKMDLRWLERNLGGERPPPPREALLARLREAEDIVDSALRSVQKIATDLRPGVLDNLGLGTAIRYECHRFESRFGIPCDAAGVEEQHDVDPEVATAAFRIFQEVLTNVARHAQAGRVDVALAGSPAGLRMEVRDDGGGIPAAALVNPRSLGLLGMRERADLLGGAVEFDAGSGGTRVVVRLPRRKP